jgi:hypothetical protein
MEAMLGISPYSHPYLKLENADFLIIVYVFSSTKLEKRAEQVLPGSEGGGEERKEMGSWRRDPNNVCTYEGMN